MIALIRASRPYLLPILAATFFTLLGLLVFQRTERYLTQNQRFVLRPGELGRSQSPDLVISGLHRASELRVNAVFAPDHGRSVFEIPIEERRVELERIPWIRSASVSRVWPNRVLAGFIERTPVAYVHLPPERRGRPVRPRLIDEDGVLLDVPGQISGPLPVLTGVREDQSVKERSDRVLLMRRLQSELGEPGRPTSEFDVRDPENLKIVFPTGDHAVTLILGNAEWRARFDRFLRHYPEIRRKMPNAIELDLRFKERIIATELDKEIDGE